MQSVSLKESRRTMLLVKFAEGLLTGIEKGGSFESLVHHPIVQAIGYGALAAEGIHAIAGGNYLPGKALKARGAHWAHSTPSGKAFGLGALGLSTAFLGAEGLAALSSYLKKHRTLPTPPSAVRQAVAEPTKMIVIKPLKKLRLPKFPPKVMR